MAKKEAQEKNPTVELSKEEQKALASLESADKEIVASMEERNAETEANEKETDEFRKNAKNGRKVKDLSVRRGK